MKGQIQESHGNCSQRDVHKCCVCVRGWLACSAFLQSDKTVPESPACFAISVLGRLSRVSSRTANFKAHDEASTGALLPMLVFSALCRVFPWLMVLGFCFCCHLGCRTSLCLSTLCLHFRLVAFIQTCDEFFSVKSCWFCPGRGVVS